MKSPQYQRLLPLIICAALFGCTSVPLPSKSSITTIEVCSGRRDCNNGKFKIEDNVSITSAIEMLLPFESGWRTETQMALTTGWFTYPTPEDHVLFRNRDGEVILVIWFGTGWMGAAVYDGNNQGKYFRSTSAEEVKALREALHITSGST